MGLIGFLAPARGRHRRATPSVGRERLTRLIGTLAVTAAAALGPAAAATALAAPAAPATAAPAEQDTPRVHQVEMARTGGTAEQLWLLGGVALSLTAAGIVAVAATRGRRRRDH
ncbi:hypothetical protein ABZ070_07505 [Streptomyces sp. NPDC006283]|uniref:hypothetical protein n=1 Tax=Streptomyces sp. NPDC006283 TaxID=3156741 RepID=UPI0033A03E1C